MLKDDDAAQEPRRLRRSRAVGMATVIVGLCLAVWPAAPLWVLLAGLSSALAVGLPLLLASSARWASAALPLAVIVVIALGAWAPYARATGSGSARDRTHDGGVLVTREAARLAVRGENPYTARYDDVLPPSWAKVQGIDGDLVANPVIEHEPYLPASFLVQVPLAEVARSLGFGWDPRIFGWLALSGTVLVLARRPDPAWRRLAAVATVANAYTFTYLAWGTNDSLAVCSFILAVLLAEDRPGSPSRPGWAGAFLAVAISCKFLFFVAVAPLAAVVVAGAGWAALRRWWSLPAILAGTCLPYLLWAPGAFLDDVLWFNLGRTEPRMPTSGLGLPATAGGIFHGPVLMVVTLLGAAVAFALVPWMARRLRSMAWVGPLTSIALLGLLVPARTFQINYLVLVVASVATWWVMGRTTGPPSRSESARRQGGERDVSSAARLVGADDGR